MYIEIIVDLSGKIRCTIALFLNSNTLLVDINMTVIPFTFTGTEQP